MNRIMGVMLLLLVTSPSWSLGERADYDLDQDGLIEINDLADLDEIRNNLDGKSLYGSNTGCPESGCKGFELTKNLDFDTNADGVIDEKDTYWNRGQGWEPIGDISDSGSFSATFDGNGKKIKNMFINSGYKNNGLFGGAINSTIINAGLTNVSINGGSSTGSFVGVSHGGLIKECYSTGNIIGSDNSGGLVGSNYKNELSIVASFTIGSVGGYYYAGGLVGFGGLIHVSNSFSTVSLSGNGYGVIGRNYYENEINNVYMAGTVGGSYANTSIASEDSNLMPINSYRATNIFEPDSSSKKGQGASIAQLQCPTSSNNTDCVANTTLYKNWEQAKDAQGNAYWDFGTANQLPGLRLNGVVYRDSDADGVLDSEDAFPNNRAAFTDADKDGFPDSWYLNCDDDCRKSSGLWLDDFPHIAAARLDVDRDGLPDEWNTDCDVNCQTASGLILDTKPSDADNDGILDSVDNDDNNDGKLDVDADGDGLIEIHSWTELDAVRYNLSGSGRKMSIIADLDTGGCPTQIIEGIRQTQCWGYELVTDLDFDTNADGKLDAQDQYWNEGRGWLPIDHDYDFVDSKIQFDAIFEGNHHVIRNLMINNLGNSGLFGLVGQMHLRNLGLTGSLMSIHSDGLLVGSLAAGVIDGSIEGCYATGVVKGNTVVGGLIGLLGRSTIHNSFTTGSVTGNSPDRGGQLVGSSDDLGQISNSFSTAQVNHNRLLVGNSLNEAKVTASFAANGAQATLGRYFDRGGVSSPLTLEQLRCPTAVGDNSCTPGLTMYEGWEQAKDAQGNPYWDFGNANQLPGLVLNGKVYRDSDADGALDADDAFLNNSAASVDSDKDGFPDSWSINCDVDCRKASGLWLDDFPHIAAARLDADRDGLPDEWNTGCGASCQATSGLILDSNPSDADNDGILDSVDNDDNNDGRIDADIDGDGLIEIHSWAELDAVRYNLTGSGRQMAKDAALDSSGCPTQIIDGVSQPRCSGYELMTDLDFDSNADGKLDAADSYWNEGQGWLPIGEDDLYPPAGSFAATFEGNHHVIRNLMIHDRTVSGLFGWVGSVHLRNLGLTGPLMSIDGYQYAGSLAAVVMNGSIEGCYATGMVQGRGYGISGGLIGLLGRSTIHNSFTTGSVTGNSSDRGGQLVGSIYGLGQISNSFSTAQVNHNRLLVGDSLNEAKVTASFAANGAQATLGRYFDRGGVSSPLTLEQLRCPTAAGDNSCVPGLTMYEGWEQAKDAQGNPYWDFGSASQLPGLVLNGKVYRDSDADGALDADDAFPNNAAASQDQDKDGLPDSWNLTCDSLCQGASGLSLDVKARPLFWHHQDGTNYLLDVDGRQFNNERELNRIPVGWFVAGQGDFNADGETDIVWRNDSTGEVYLYLMQQASIKQQASLANISDLTWQIAAVSDVNGDHKADLIWRNQRTGEAVVWLMDALHYTNELALTQVSDLNWHLDGSGDFDGDGTADLYWHNHKTGENYLFMMKNGQIQTELELFRVADTAWQVAALGDFNADGKTDMYWRNNQTGENYVILMNGSQVIGERDAVKVADLNWQVVANADFDGDAKADLLWRHKTTGENHLFLLDGLNLKADYPLPQVKDLNWQVGAVLTSH